MGPSAMADGRLRVAFLVGQDNASTRLSIEYVCRVPNVIPVTVLVDTQKDTLAKRLRNLRRNVRREGLSYLFFRALLGLREIFDQWTAKVAPPAEVEQLLRKAFPAACFSLHDLAAIYGFEVAEVGNLNGDSAAKRLSQCSADLGLVLGTRILKRTTFAVPRLGCVNLHKGKVPEFRGMPPGFWELYQGCSSAGVTVHFVDDRLDTGDIVGTAEVPIHPKETPESLKTKLDEAGAHLLASTVADLIVGKATRTPQPPTQQKPWSTPTRVQRRELQRRLPHWRVQSDASEAFKTFFHLILFHCGIYRSVRWFRRRRGAILLYHRVNDYSIDVLTTSCRRFAEHLIVLSRNYKVVASNRLVECLMKGIQFSPGTVVVHFDDCYRDVYSYAAPLLRAAELPATAFVSSGFIDTDRAFAHDEQKYPHVFENFRSQDVCALAKYGLDIGSHTVNHADLGSVELDQARLEVFESRHQLEQILGTPVSLFSFPFGGLDNIREEVRQLVRQAGYQALFSAHGGFVESSTDRFDIPRVGVSSEHSALCLMMDLEGLSVSQLRHRFAKKQVRASET